MRPGLVPVPAVLALWLAGCVDLRPPPLLEGVGGVHLNDAGATTADGKAPASDGKAPAPGEDAGDERPRAINGHACAEGAGCASSFCVDGVCCASACEGPCRACNVAGLEGTCNAVPSGEDPDDDCGQEAVAICGLDGTCDGRGGCRRYPRGTECGPGSCAASIEHAASTCDDDGRCVAGASRTCATMCKGGSCGTTCASASECQDGFFCMGTCTLKRPVSAACTGGAECGSGFCVDGVCCDNECKQSCYACNLPGSAGTCTVVPAAADPRHDCAAEPAAGCGRAGGCNGKGGCLLHPAGTVCAEASCAGGRQSAAGTCDGLGTCAPGAAHDCGAYTCGAAACRTTCAGDGECTGGNKCTNGACGPPPPPPPPVGLLLRWRFDETTGAVATDSSGNGLDGTYTGEAGTPAPSAMVPPTMFANPGSRAFDMSGRQAVRVSPVPAKLQPASGFTVSFWFRATAVDDVGADAFNLAGGYVVRLKSGTIEWVKHASNASGMMNEVCLSTLTGHLDGKWHHAAGVNDGAGMRFYLDGQSLCTKASTAAPIYALAELSVGRNAGGATTLDFGGNIDDLRIYGRALSAAELTALSMGND
jgi:hypothetical protein